MPDTRPIRVRIDLTHQQFRDANPWDPNFPASLDTATLHTLRRVLTCQLLMGPLPTEMVDAITQELDSR